METEAKGSYVDFGRARVQTGHETVRTSGHETKFEVHFPAAYENGNVLVAIGLAGFHATAAGGHGLEVQVWASNVNETGFTYTVWRNDAMEDCTVRVTWTSFGPVPS